MIIVMESLIGIAGTVILAMIGAAVGYGKLKARAQTNSKTIENMRQSFVPKTECTERHERVEETIQQLKATADHQTKSLAAMTNYARYILTKEGLNPAEINDVLENGN